MGGTETVQFLDRYYTLIVEPFVEYENEKFYLVETIVNGKSLVSTPKLYLNESINDVVLQYSLIDSFTVFGGVFAEFYNVSSAGVLPQFGNLEGAISFPRGCYYKGLKTGAITLDLRLFAFPLDLDKEDFEIWRNGIKFTLHLNRENKVKIPPVIYNCFDIIKAEFYGELLPAENIDDYLKLKPKGV